MKVMNLLLSLLAAFLGFARVFVAVVFALVLDLGGYLRRVASPPGVGYAIYDSQLYFRSTTDSLTQTETSAALTINGTPADGLAIVIDVPKKSVGDTMQLSLQHSTDNSTWTTLLNVETVASVTAASTVPFKIVRRFFTRNKYVRSVITVAGTSPDFGAVIARIGDDSQWNLLSVGQNATANP